MHIRKYYVKITKTACIYASTLPTLSDTATVYLLLFQASHILQWYIVLQESLANLMNCS